MDYVSELFLQRLLRDIRKAQGCDEISEEVLAAAEYFAYSSTYCSYEMLKGAIPRRYINTGKPCMDLYLPAPLLNLFSKSVGAGAPQKKRGVSRAKTQRLLDRPRKLSSFSGSGSPASAAFSMMEMASFII